MRYRHFFILILSLILPLQAAAGALLNAPCSDAAEMSAMGDEKVMHAMADMPCCPDQVAADAPDCKTLDSCHLCKIQCQLVIYRAAAFSPALNGADHLPLAHLSRAIFNPASIWRPPSIT